MKQELSAEYVRSILHYDPESGLFTWKVKRKLEAGSIAGTVNGRGYIQISIDGKLYLAHRLAHLFMLGTFPPDGVDHRNGIKSDNRWENLRPATQTQNNGNMKIRSNNTSGHRGVSWDRGKWLAQVRVNGKNYNLGRYDDPVYAAAIHAGAHKLIHGDFSHASINVTINIFNNTQRGAA